jgi:hypothetical protein
MAATGCSAGRGTGVSEAPRVLLYALIAGLSPLAFLSTLAVLGSGRGRVNGGAFGTGFLLTQSTVLVVAVLVGSAATPDRERSHPDLMAILELTVGLALLALAWRLRVSRVQRTESRSKALLVKLRGLRPATAFAVGGLLGVGGVKRLTITLLAGATIAAAGLDPGEELGLGILYVLVATLLVWVPLGVSFIAGRRADAMNERAEAWLIANEQRATVLSTLIFGLLVSGDALARLA